MPLSRDEFLALTEVLPNSCDLIHQKDVAGKVRRVFVDLEQVLQCIALCVDKGGKLVGTNGAPLVSTS